MTETEFKFDVFISYSHKDEEWVRNILLPTLEKQGLKVCIDYRDFIAGKPAIINMQDASEESRHTLLVLTPRWMASEWTLYESILSRTDDPSGLQRRTIPLLLEKCDVPKFISMLSWVDFTDKKRENEAWQNLFKSLDKEVENVEIAKAEPDSWHLAHPYPMPPNFTGRVAERTLLTNWLNEDSENRLFILRALGGFGKSALTWHWLNNDVNPAEWTKLIWWSFYEGDASFEHFIEETLKYLKIEVPQGGRPQVDKLLDAMKKQKILLIMDGFERALRAYSSMNAAYQGDSELPSPLGEGLGGGVESALDCVNLNAEIFLKSVCSLPNIKSKVLMTTRLTPRAVKPRGEFMLGCREAELTSMQPADAVEFFRKQKIKGTHTEIEAACAPYGYHPLSLRLLAGRILKDFENPADIVVAQKLKIDGDIIQQKHHVLEVSYNSLPPHEGKLLSTIACFRSPVDLKTLEAIEEDNKSLQDDLHDLVARGLLHFDEKNKKFDLHPIVRRFAYERLTDKTQMHKRLIDYFRQETDNKYLEEARFIWGVDPTRFRSVSDLEPVIELYYQAVSGRDYGLAYRIIRYEIGSPLWYLNEHQLRVKFLQGLYPDGGDKLPSWPEYVQGWVSRQLGLSYTFLGYPRLARSFFEKAQRFYMGASRLIGVDTKQDIAGCLGDIARLHLVLGNLAAAEENMRLRISACQQMKQESESERLSPIDRIVKKNDAERHGGFAYADLALVLASCGKFDEAYQNLDIAREWFGEDKFWLGRTHIYANRVQIALYQKKGLEAEQEAWRAAQLANDAGDIGASQNVDREIIHAEWLLGAALIMVGKDLSTAATHLSDALTRCRRISMVDHEPDILLAWARWHRARGNAEEAREKAVEALAIADRCEYRLTRAEIHNFLAQVALEQEKNKVKAKEYAEEALKLATCDGPPYYYKVAYEEAERMLEKLNNT